MHRRLAGAAALDERFARELAHPLADFTLSGGHRRRAALLWWGWRACGGARRGERPDAVLDLAAAVELIQSCALVHDDVMDGSRTRRGRPALHIAQAAPPPTPSDGRPEHARPEPGRPGHGPAERPAPHVEERGRAAAAEARRRTPEPDRPGSEPDTPGSHPTAGAGPGSAAGREGAAPYGWSVAVLAGDLALAWADDTVAEAGLTVEARRRVEAVWRDLRTEMVAGQYLELRAQAAGDRSAGQALRTARLKSALYSVARPLDLGAAVAGAGEEVRRGLRLAGGCAGLAFQLRDDLLGVFGDPAETGKPSGDDIREGKPTYLAALARARAAAADDHGALRVLDSAMGDRALDPAALAAVREVITATGARAAVESRIALLAERCAHRLRELPLDAWPRARMLDVLLTATGLPPGSAPGR
ncbi:polyprenyl synthetase family protein [Actinacidiphila yeochonensis]|uniref:polyprenyl synthetase family protein n=1 Tax=Actinacidiphila yeochonensis TaxID=89050 RepID=UPI001E338813|nr:polyprenyl synthetase family protein [Actinacidiphila yeochonensis]